VLSSYICRRCFDPRVLTVVHHSCYVFFTSQFVNHMSTTLTTACTECMMLTSVCYIVLACNANSPVPYNLELSSNHPNLLEDSSRDLRPLSPPTAFHWDAICSDVAVDRTLLLLEVLDLRPIDWRNAGQFILAGVRFINSTPIFSSPH